MIDEEQRFGVKHKEQLKQMRRDVDVLTLTATPIPRSLHMGLMQVRDLSVIATRARRTPADQDLPASRLTNITSARLSCANWIAAARSILCITACKRSRPWRAAAASGAASAHRDGARSDAGGRP